MNQTQKTMRNSVVGVTGQVIYTLLNFFSRRVFVQYFGVELLGLNSTFASILNTLSLAELGFQQVIVFYLYGVLAKGDKERINAIVNIYRFVYRCIGCLFVAAALLCMPFLQFFLSDIEATNTVRLYFLIQALTNACTYFLAYKRNILYADQNSYIAVLIDTVVNTIAVIVAIFIAIYTRNYILYLFVDLIKTYLSNLFVHVACTRKYPYLYATRIDWPLLQEMASSLKDVVVEKLAGYVYSSTDNLLISTFISTIQVGFLNNYTLVINHVKTLMASLTTPLVPAIGNMVAVGRGETHQLETFRLLEQIYFWLAGFAVVPVYVLADSFIEMYIGSEFILPRVLLLLLCVDLYVHISQDSCRCFLSANGLFKKRRNISLGGAFINPSMSLLLMKPFGTAGVLAGTAFSQIYYWIARSIVAILDCLNQRKKTLATYWLKQAGLLGIIIAATIISKVITDQIFVLNGIFTFVVNGVICELCFCLLALICCRGIRAQRRLEEIALGMLKKGIHKLIR